MGYAALAHSAFRPYVCYMTCKELDVASVPPVLAVSGPKARRRVIRTVDLSDEKFEQIRQSWMDPRHDHLNALLDDE